MADDTGDDRADDEPPPDDLLTPRDACKLLPSPKAGCRTHMSTIYRYINSGRLRAWGNGRYVFVSAAEVRDLLRPRPVAARLRAEAPSRREKEARRRVERETKAILDRAGI